MYTCRLRLERLVRLHTTLESECKCAAICFKTVIFLVRISGSGSTLLEAYFLRIPALFWGRYSGTVIVNSSSAFDIPVSQAEERIQTV